MHAALRKWAACAASHCSRLCSCLRCAIARQHWLDSSGSTWATTLSSSCSTGSAGQSAPRSRVVSCHAVSEGSGKGAKLG
jgi:hypothetical protein